MRSFPWRWAMRTLREFRAPGSPLSLNAAMDPRSRSRLNSWRSYFRSLTELSGEPHTILRLWISDCVWLFHCPTRHGDVVVQVIRFFVAQSVDLSVWQDVQGLGILYLSVIAGEMNLKVCELTKAPGTPCVSTFGM